MSVQCLYTAATGMESLQSKLDTISNNLANVNTTSFKRDRTNFEDLFYQNEVLPGAVDSSGQPTANGIHTGLGVRVASSQIDFKQGSFQQTGNQYDVAIAGNGFFQVQDPSTSTIMYTRAGNFSINANNQVVMGSATTGRLLIPNITVPIDTTGIVISPEGLVQVHQANSPTLNTVGQIQLAQFPNQQGLLKQGENLYSETPSSGTQVLGNPGANGLGTLQQNSLEQSNVEPVQELIDLITTQRAFELNSQAVQAGNQVLQAVVALPRS
ncbi:MAG TPA: flagellar basal-body rod protein FlgG [Pirellulales bacterium]|jgi:flagellar basal-body rod protein FlgG|nr:flagellar basal-body rod protein FlgG [Pirellulales bacterium]